MICARSEKSRRVFRFQALAMPILSNSRHERFAQGLAAGKTAGDAYEAAGYKPNAHNAATLRRKQTISTRVAELLKPAADAIESAGKAAGVSIQTIHAMLLEDRALARENSQAAAAVKATESLGRLYGLYVERQTTDGTVRILSDKPMTEDEWQREYAGASPVGSSGGTTESFN
jgi:hypothetical protein